MAQHKDLPLAQLYRVGLEVQQEAQGMFLWLLKRRLWPQRRRPSGTSNLPLTRLFRNYVVKMATAGFRNNKHSGRVLIFWRMNAILTTSCMKEHRK